MRVLQRRARRGADVLEDHAVDEAFVFFQIHQAIAIDPEDFADMGFREVGHRDFMKRTFDDDLVGADAVHLVVNAIAALLQVPLDLQGGKLVGYHAHAPAPRWVSPLRSR